MGDIVLAGATSGTTTLTPTAVSGTTTLTLPATTDTLVGKTTTDTLTNKSIVATQLTGTIAAARLPTGSVLQVVNAAFSTEVSTTTTTFVDTGLTATITPTSATSKILVIVDHADVFKRLGNTGCGQRLLKGASVLTTISKYAADNNSTTYGMVGGCGINYLDSPATTSPTTYKTQINSTQNVAQVGINYNDSTSTITLMEIAA